MDVSWWKNKNVLITGGHGYLGSGLVHALGAAECNMILQSRSLRTSSFSGCAKINNLTGDLKDLQFWVNVMKDVDVVFHLAAQTSVYAADADPIGNYQSNVLPALNLFDVLQRIERCPTIVFSSTVTIFGMGERLPVNEDCPENLLTTYDLHKFLAEKYFVLAKNMEIARTVNLRLPNIYGPGPKSSSADRGILNLMIQKALKGEELTVYGEGQEMRDYVFVEDVVEAFIRAAERAPSLEGSHFVLGTGRGYSISQAIKLVADRVKAVSGKSVLVKNIPSPQSQAKIEKRNFVADASRFKTQTGWDCRYQLQEGIDRTIQSFV